MAEHGDLQLPVIQARPNEQADQAAGDAIQEQREHEAQSDRLRAPATTPLVTGPIEFDYPTRR
jgi:hypothetical protein